jgi:RNase P subunit RPR2
MSFIRYGEVTKIENYEFGPDSKDVICEKCNNVIGKRDSRYIKIFNRIYPIQNVVGTKIFCKKCGNAVLIKE